MEFPYAPVLPFVSTVVLLAISVLLGLVVWFLRREITSNDRAHTELGRRIEKVDTKVDNLGRIVDAVARDVAYIRGLLTDVRPMQTGHVRWERHGQSPN